jgi:hypothetical protein
MLSIQWISFVVPIGAGIALPPRDHAGGSYLEDGSMANYLLVYRGGSMPETPAEQEQVMKAWNDWFGKIGGALVDGGNPASQTKVVTKDGSVSNGGSDSPTGYSIIKADDIDSAVTLAKGCPVFLGGATIDVVETFAVM